MGRIFEKRKARMFARWSKTSKAFTKVGKEIAIAVKLGGPDPAGNPRLRMAMQTARSLNMPKDRILSAISRANSKDAASLEEINYEAYGPYGVALFIETATDNPTRTVANVRSILNKNGGSIGSVGCLEYLFERKGVFTITPPEGDIEELELELIDFGLEDMFETEEGLLLFSSFSQFGALQKALEERKIEVKSASSQRIPLTHAQITPEQEEEVLELIESLDEDDDVQHVYHNMPASSD